MAAAASFGSGAAAAAAASLGSSFNPNRDYELSGDIEFSGNVTAQRTVTAESNVVIAGNLSVAGDIDICGSNLNPVVASGENNVLESLQVGGTTYTLPTGGASALDDLTDVSVSTMPADGQALVYDDTSQKWVQGTGLSGWTDSSGHLIPNNNAQYDIGSAEKKVRHLYLSQNSLFMGPSDNDNQGTAISLDASGDLTVGGTKLIKGDAEGKVPTDKMPTNVTSVVASSDGDTNVLSSLQVGDTTYTLPSSGSGGGASVLTDLTDVSAASASNGQYLIYDTSTNQWQSSDLMTVTYTGPVDFVSSSSQPANSVWSVESGRESDQNGTERINMYNNSRDSGNSYNIYTNNTDGATTESNPIELIYTPETPQIITEFKSWSQVDANGHSDDRYPATIEVHGYTGSEYVLLGTQTLQSFTDLSGTLPTSANSLHSMTFNSSKTSYEKYKIKMYTVFDSTDNYHVILGELNLKGYTKSMAPFQAALDGLYDVSAASASNGQALVYDETSQKWQPGTVATSGSGDGASALDDLTDVSAASASNGQYLIYDSSLQKWRPSTLASSGYASGVAFNSSGSIMGNGSEVYTSWSNNPSSSESAIRSDSSTSGSCWVGQQFTHDFGYFYPTSAGTYLVSAHANFLRDGDSNNIPYTAALGLRLTDEDEDDVWQKQRYSEAYSSVNVPNQQFFLSISRVLDLSSTVGVAFTADSTETDMRKISFAITPIGAGTVATSGSGGASTLNDLTDVSAASASNGQALVYDTSTNQWEPGTAGTSVTANPGGTPATTLSTVRIAGIDYTLPGDDLVGVVTENFTYGGSTALTYLSSTDSVSGNIHTGLHTMTNGVKISTNWNRSSFDNRAVYECFDGSLVPGDTYNAVSNTHPPIVNGEYGSGHYVWVDIEFPNPSKITNLRMWTRNDPNSDHSFPRKFQWYAQSGTQTNASSYTTTGDYVQPNANDLGNWTSITSLFSGTITAATSDTATSSNHTYNVSVSDSTYYDRIRLVVTQGSSTYSSTGAFIIGEIQIDGAFQKPVVESLSAIANVSTTAPASGQALVYDTSTNQWEPGTAGTSVAAHTDTQTGNEDYLSALTVDGTKYKVGTSISTLADVGDVSSATPSDGQPLVYNSSVNEWQPTSMVTRTISYATDVFSHSEQTYKGHMTLYEGTIQTSQTETIQTEVDDLIDNLITSDSEYFFAGNKTSATGYLTFRFAAGGKLIVTRLLEWHRSSNSTINFPTQVKIYGSDIPDPVLDNLTPLAQNTNISTSNPSSFTIANANLDISFNPSKTRYSYYFFRFYGDSSRTDLLISELNLKGYIYNIEWSELTLNSLSDVDTATTTPAEGQALVYNGTSEQWEPGTVGSTLTVQDEGTDLSTAATTLNFEGSGVTASGTGAVKTITIDAPSQLSEIGNVSTTAPASGQALVYSGNQWQPSDLMTVTYTGPVDFVSYSNPPADSVWSVGSGTTENSSDARQHLYDNNRSHSSSNTYYIYRTDENAPTASAPIELIYTPASPQIITEFESWARYNGSSSVGNDNMYPATIKVYGYTGSQYVELVPTAGSQTIASFTHHSGITPTSANSLHSMTFNSSKTSYEKYKFVMYDTFRSDILKHNVVIGELNLRGYTKSTALSSLADVGDVSTTGAQAGQALVYSGTQWEPGTAGTSVAANPPGTPTSDLTKVTIGTTDYNVGQQRNYQYKQVETTHTSITLDQNWRDLTGLNGSNALQITTTVDNSKVRVHYIIRGEPSFDTNYDIVFRLARTVGGVTTSLNAPSNANFSQTLANAEQGYYDADQNTTMDTWEIYYVDTLTASAGSLVSYVPQFKTVSSNTALTGTFSLNRTNYTTGETRESTISVGECEEILTGPPLTVNNVAISSTPTAGDFIQYNGSAWTNTSVSLEDITNVSTAIPSEGQALVYNASNQWVPGTVASVSNGTSAIDATYFHCSQSPLDTSINSANLPSLPTSYSSAMYAMRLQGTSNHTRAFYVGTVNDNSGYTDANAFGILSENEGGEDPDTALVVTRQGYVHANEFNANAYEVNNTPLITQVYTLKKQNSGYAQSGWLIETGITNLSSSDDFIWAFKSVVNMRPYAISFSSDKASGLHTATDFTFQVRSAKTDTDDNRLTTSNTDSKGTFYINGMYENSGDYALISSLPGIIPAGRHWGVYLTYVSRSDYVPDFMIRVHFSQVR